MKRAREEEEDKSQMTLDTCVKKMKHRKWLREEFAGFPIEIFADCLMAQLAPHAASLLFLAMTCKEIYHGPWRSKYGRTLEIGEYDEEKWGEGQFKGSESFSRGALNLFAPFVENLTYHLPCHHGWHPLDLAPCIVLKQLTFIGDECYSGNWDTPLPVTLCDMILKRYHVNNIHWKTVFRGETGRRITVKHRAYDDKLQKMCDVASTYGLFNTDSGVIVLRTDDRWIYKNQEEENMVNNKKT
jgi:hypothetical protein